MAEKVNFEDPEAWTLTVKTTKGYENKLTAIASEMNLLDSKRGPNRSEATRIAIDRLFSNQKHEGDNGLSKVGLIDVLIGAKQASQRVQKILRSDEHVSLQCGSYGFISTFEGDQKLIRERIKKGQRTFILTPHPDKFEPVKNLTKREFLAGYAESMELMLDGVRDLVKESLRTESPVLSIISSSGISDSKDGIFIGEQELIVTPWYFLNVSVGNLQSFSWVFQPAKSPSSAFDIYKEFFDGWIQIAKRNPDRDLLARYLKKRPR